MKNYYVESWSQWFAVKAWNVRKARSEGVAEFGRGMVKGVREATKDEVASFVAQKGVGALKGSDT